MRDREGEAVREEQIVRLSAPDWGHVKARCSNVKNVHECMS